MELSALKDTSESTAYWPRLQKESGKLNFVKTDFSKWVDEDEDDEPVYDPQGQFNEQMMFQQLMAQQGGMAGMDPNNIPKIDGQVKHFNYRKKLIQTTKICPHLNKCVLEFIYAPVFLDFWQGICFATRVSRRKFGMLPRNPDSTDILYKPMDKMVGRLNQSSPTSFTLKRQVGQNVKINSMPLNFHDTKQLLANTETKNNNSRAEIRIRSSVLRGSSSETTTIAPRRMKRKVSKLKIDSRIQTNRISNCSW